MMRSHKSNVDSRCATTNTIASRPNSAIVSRITDSDFTSILLVGSSNTTTSGSPAQRQHDRQPLLLPPRQLPALLTYVRVIPLRPRHDLVMEMGAHGGLLHVGITHRRPEEPNVLPHSPAVQMRLLRHERHQSRPVERRDLTHVHTVHQDPPRRRIPQPQQQLHQRRLPRPRRTHDPNHLTPRHPERHIRQRKPATAVVGIGDVEHFDLVGGAVARRVRVDRAPRRSVRAARVTPSTAKARAAAVCAASSRAGAACGRPSACA